MNSERKDGGGEEGERYQPNGEENMFVIKIANARMVFMQALPAMS